MNILITSAGRRVSLVKSFQKELKKIFSEGKVFTTDMDPQLSGACQVADGYFKVENVCANDYIDHLIRICIENQIKLIIPTIDTELIPLSDHKRKFEEAGILCLVSDEKLIRSCRNKRLTHKLFEEYNVNFAKEFSHDKPQFPLFIKPIDGSSSKDLHFIKEESELSGSLIENANLMFLEYIDPKENTEYTLDMYFDKNSNLKCFVPRERIRVRDGEISIGKTVKNEILDYIHKRFSFFPGFIGCITLQLFHNSETNDVCGIEINPRFGGGYPLSYHAGANFPKWIIEEYLLNQSIEYYSEWESGLLMLRYDEEILVHGT
jgi:carbamoyl-phosphate synthase large subunit